jgi:predicted P-loop ATPase
MREENERKHEKSVLIMWERKVKQNLVSELVSEYYSSELVSNFTHQNFLVKMVRLLGVVLECFHQIDSPK